MPRGPYSSYPLSSPILSPSSPILSLLPSYLPPLLSSLFSHPISLLSDGKRCSRPPRDAQAARPHARLRPAGLDGARRGAADLRARVRTLLGDPGLLGLALVGEPERADEARFSRWLQAPGSGPAGPDERAAAAAGGGPGGEEAAAGGGEAVQEAGQGVWVPERHTVLTLVVALAHPRTR